MSDEDVAAIRAIGASYAEAALAGNRDAAAALFADDAVFMAQGAPAIEGRAAIWAALEPPPGITTQEATVTSLEIDGYGDLAYDRGTFSRTVTMEGVAEPITYTAKYLVIARKQDDGSWLWSIDIWNTDAPMPQPG